MALPVFTAGRKVRASELQALANSCAAEVGFAHRATSGTATTTTEKTYLRLDGVPLLGGYSYLIQTCPMIIESSVAADLVQITLRGSTSGSATTASTAFTLLAQPSKSASGAQNTAMLSFRYNPGSDGTLSLLLSYLRASGSGNVRINASSDIPVQLTVWRLGLAQLDTGVDL